MTTPICPTCLQTPKSLGIASKVWSNHVRWCLYRSLPEEDKAIFSNKMSDLVADRYGYTRIPVQVPCKECGAVFSTRQCLKDGVPVSWRKKAVSSLERMYCSRSCANKQGSKFVSTETRALIAEKVSVSMKALWQDPTYAPSGHNNRVLSSKREREILSFLRGQESGWKKGFIGTYMGIPINPDCWSRERKVVIEYDGIWHFKDIHGQLAKKQRIDRFTEAWCRAHRYRLIRIDEDANLSLEDIWNLVDIKTDQIIKVGIRYPET